MDKKTLNQYRALAKEIPKLKKDIERLLKRLDAIPEMKGKVSKSADEFPYIQQHITVDVKEPRAATEIKQQIRYKELRLNKAETDKTRIEKFIAGIEDSTDRQIFELIFIDGMKQYLVGDEVGYSKGRISQIISSYLKD